MEPITAETTTQRPSRPPAPPPASSRAAGYDEDFCLWAEHQAKLLREGALRQLDLPHLIEEVEDMGISQKHAIVNNLVVVVMHLLKYQFQPKRRSRSWRLSILEHRRRIKRRISDSPSLLRYAGQQFDDVYQDARKEASVETGLKLSRFPEQCPWTLEQVLDQEFLPK